MPAAACDFVTCELCELLWVRGTVLQKKQRSVAQLTLLPVNAVNCYGCGGQYGRNNSDQLRS
jgi:hypothetical protein